MKKTNGKRILSALVAGTLAGALLTAPPALAEGEVELLPEAGQVYRIYAYGDSVISANENNRDQNYDKLSDTFFGSEYGDSISHFIVEYHTEDLPSTSYIQSATLGYKSKGGAPADRTYSVFPCGAGWDETTVTYNTMAEAGGLPGEAIATETKGEISSETIFTFDITEYLQGKTGDIGFAMHSPDAGQGNMRVYQKEHREWEGVLDGSRIEVTYDIPALLADLNQATEENIEELIIENGALLGIYADAYALLSDKTAVNQALLAGDFDSIESAATAANTAIQKQLVFTRVGAASNQTGTVWSTGAVQADNPNARLVRGDFSGLPTEHRVLTKFYISTNSGRTSGDDKPDYYYSTQLLMESTYPYKNLGFLRIDDTNVFGTAIDVAGEQVEFAIVEGINNDCFNDIASGAYFLVGYEKTGIYADLSSAGSIGRVKTLLSQFGVMLGIEQSALTANLDAYSLAVYCADPITTDDEFKAVIDNYETVVAENALPMLNACDSEETFGENFMVIAPALGLDISILGRLANSAGILSKIYAAKGDGFTSPAALAETFETLMSAEVTAPVRSIAAVDYNYGGGEGTINNASNWQSALLTQFNVNSDLGIASKHLVRVTYNHKQAERGEAALAQAEVMLHEISPAGWEDRTPTTNAAVQELGVIDDTSKPVATAERLDCPNGGWVTVDVSGYFIQDGQFTKTPGETFALRTNVNTAANGVSTFYEAGDSQLDQAPYLTFEYDLGGIVTDFAAAKTNEEIDQLICQEGTVLGIDAEAYKNLSHKETVWNAVRGKAFANAAELTAAIQNALDSLLYVETISMQETGWGTIAADGTESNQNAADYWMPKGRNEYMYLRFPINNAQFDLQYAAGAQVRIQRRNGGEEDGVENYSQPRYILFSSRNTSDSVMAYSNNSLKGGDYITADITPLLKDAGDTLTVYARGSVVNSKESGNMVSTPISNLDPGKTYAENRFAIDISYDKLAIANAIAEAGTIQDAQRLMEINYRVFGLEEADAPSAAAALFGSPVATADELEYVLSAALSGGVLFSGFTKMPEPIGGNTMGTVTIKNLSDTEKAVQVMVAAYNEDGEMLQAALVDFGGQIEAAASATQTYALMGVTEAYALKAFLWDSLAGLQPYDIPRVLTAE